MSDSAVQFEHTWEVEIGGECVSNTFIGLSLLILNRYFNYDMNSRHVT